MQPEVLNLRISNKCLDDHGLNNLLKESKNDKITQLAQVTLTDSERVVTAVVVSSKTARNAEVSISDMKGVLAKLKCEDNSNSIWPSSDIEGLVILLINPMVSINEDKLVLTVQIQKQIFVVGKAVEFGRCGAMRKDGGQCNMPVIKLYTDHCKFHNTDAQGFITSKRPRQNAYDVTVFSSNSRDTMNAYMHRTASVIDASPHIHSSVTQLGRKQISANSHSRPSTSLNQASYNSFDFDQDLPIPLNSAALDDPHNCNSIFSDYNDAILATTNRNGAVTVPQENATVFMFGAQVMQAAEDHRKNNQSRIQNMTKTHVNNQTVTMASAGSSNIVPTRQLSSIGKISSVRSTVMPVTSAGGLRTPGIITHPNHLNTNITHATMSTAIASALPKRVLSGSDRQGHGSLAIVGGVLLDTTVLSRNADMALARATHAHAPPSVGVTALINGTGITKQHLQQQQELLSQQHKKQKVQASKMNELDELLARKSSHEKEAETEWFESYGKRIDNMARNEAREEMISKIHCMKVAGFQCEDCQLFLERIGPLCRPRGHKIKSIVLTKRFFECNKCKKRAHCLQAFMMNSCCEYCGSNDWTACGVHGSAESAGKRAVNASGNSSSSSSVMTSSGRLVLVASENTSRADCDSMAIRVSSLDHG